MWREGDCKLGGSKGGWMPGDGPLPDLGPPKQLRMRAGDVVVTHSEMAHCGGPHLGPDIRYMIYFRIRHRDWAKMFKSAALVADMWVDLEGVHPLRDSGKLEPTPAPSGWELGLDST
eukprot:TRINITY_DN93662_c0_g1_i1.p1 TRINITY_DN93662_c0_g1~~TRINITY_DN93662_c0_g1_i1.p1  ORF type:complete len:117 (-),score=4.74 TRINITY_DN93662_c0_g1_i1:95-445(-)